MLLFVLWSVLVVAALVGAGYSHYRYRVINNQYYERLFAKNREGAVIKLDDRSYPSIPVIALVIACTLASVSVLL